MSKNPRSFELCLACCKRCGSPFGPLPVPVISARGIPATVKGNLFDSRHGDPVSFLHGHRAFIRCAGHADLGPSACMVVAAVRRRTVTSIQAMTLLALFASNLWVHEPRKSTPCKSRWGKPKLGSRTSRRFFISGWASRRYGWACDLRRRNQVTSHGEEESFSSKAKPIGRRRTPPPQKASFTRTLIRARIH